MAAIWTMAALLGMEGLFRLFPWTYATFKVIGALYLLYVAWQTWRTASVSVGAAPLATSSAFRGGVLVNLANPKSVFFAAAVLVVIFPRDLAVWKIAVIFANHFAVEAVFYASLAAILGTDAVASPYLRMPAAISG